MSNGIDLNKKGHKRNNSVIKASNAQIKNFAKKNLLGSDRFQNLNSLTEVQKIKLKNGKSFTDRRKTEPEMNKNWDHPSPAANLSFPVIGPAKIEGQRVKESQMS